MAVHHEIEFILQELNAIETSTCIRFVSRTTQIDFIKIINGDGCWSWVGRVGGQQELSLNRNGCLYDGTPMHETIHALGFSHMHNHIDRDNYVNISWQNILPEYHSAFDKVDPQWFDNFGTPYDLLSVMHYPRWAFTMNGEDTILPHNRTYSDKIGASMMSANDALRLNRMYDCSVEKRYSDSLHGLPKNITNQRKLIEFNL